MAVRSCLRAGGLVGSWALAMGLTGCTPSPQAVPKISTGATGCPEEQLAVFNYSRPNRTWNAACGEQQFVCSARGGMRCTKQQPETVSPELVARAKALLEVPMLQREWFVDKDLSTGSWESFALVVAAVKALSPKQLERVDPRYLFGAGSSALNEGVKACGTPGIVDVKVEANGDLMVASWCNNKAFLTSPELAPLKRHPFKSFTLVAGVFGLKPVARPPLASASAASGAAPVPAEPVKASDESTPTPAPSSPEAEAAVRQWLDGERAAILACAGKDQVAVQVSVSAESKLEVSLKGATGSPEEGCVQNALAKVPALPAGPATILHLVRAP